MEGAHDAEHGAVAQPAVEDAPQDARRRVVFDDLAGSQVGWTGAAPGQVAVEGAQVVVNDVFIENRGGPDEAPLASSVAEEIRAAGGQAVANLDSVASMPRRGDEVMVMVTSVGRFRVTRS